MKSKVISLPKRKMGRQDEMNDDDEKERLSGDLFPAKVSLSALREIWDDEQHTHTDMELMKIREWLYTVAKMVISVSQRLEKEYTVTKHQQINEHEIPQSYPLCQGEYRRAS